MGFELLWKWLVLKHSSSWHPNCLCWVGCWKIGSSPHIMLLMLHGVCVSHNRLKEETPLTQESWKWSWADLKAKISEYYQRRRKVFIAARRGTHCSLCFCWHFSAMQWWQQSQQYRLHSAHATRVSGKHWSSGSRSRDLHSTHAQSRLLLYCGVPSWGVISCWTLEAVHSCRSWLLCLSPDFHSYSFPSPSLFWSASQLVQDVKLAESNPMKKCASHLPPEPAYCEVKQTPVPAQGGSIRQRIYGKTQRWGWDCSESNEGCFELGSTACI